MLAFLKSASRGATALTGAALSALAVKVLLLNRWPAPLAFMYDFGVLVEAVLASVVASYVFYLFVVHLKEVNDKLAVGPYIDRHSDRVVGACEGQLADIARASDTTLTIETVSVDLIKTAFAKIHPYSDAPLIVSAGPPFKYANWFQYFDQYKTRTRESIAKVLSQLIYVDAKRVSLLADVEDCSHFAMLSYMLHTPMRNTDLANFSSMFHEYCARCLSLKQHLAKERGATRPG